MKIMIKGKGSFEIAQNISCYELLKKYYSEDYYKYLIVKVNKTIKELSYDSLCDGDEIEFLDLKDSDGMRVYIRTLCLIYIKACKDIFDDCDITVEHSLNKGLFSEIQINRALTQEDICQIINRMKQIIDSHISINKMMLTVEKAKNIFIRQNMPDKVLLLENWNTQCIRVYEIDGYYDTYYGYVAPNTDVIYKFDIKLFSTGVILRYPSGKNINEFPEYVEHVKLAKIFKEAEDWGDIMEISHVGALNRVIRNDSINDLILVNEALHEKKIAYIADEISADESIRIILIAGPSSSGKTTFAQRLSIQLRVNGKKTYAISLDDYFVDREKTPLDENGNYDFDTIDALDIELFNEQLVKLMNCEEVIIPTFDFKTGKRIYNKAPIKLTKDHIIVVEGIHGLNDKLTAHIKKKNKFRIYISALTQLNIDNHNRISTSDTRLIRRVVRDSQFRGHNAQKTMELWENVGKGEEKYIFPFQENADAMFNSSLIYELAVLKKYAEPLIQQIHPDSEFYPERQRLLKFLSYFISIDDEHSIPKTSILKEFIGGGLVE